MNVVGPSEHDYREKRLDKLGLRQKRDIKVVVIVIKRKRVVRIMERWGISNLMPSSNSWGKKKKTKENDRQ
jgi:hypothetical protein